MTIVVSSEIMEDFFYNCNKWFFFLGHFGAADTSSKHNIHIELPLKFI